MYAVHVCIDVRDAVLLIFLGKTTKQKSKSQRSLSVSFCSHCLLACDSLRRLTFVRVICTIRIRVRAIRLGLYG